MTNEEIIHNCGGTDYEKIMLAEMMRIRIQLEAITGQLEFFVKYHK